MRPDEEDLEETAEEETRYPPHDQERFEADYFRRRTKYQADLERVAFSGDL